MDIPNIAKTWNFISFSCFGAIANTDLVTIGGCSDLLKNRVRKEDHVEDGFLFCLTNLQLRLLAANNDLSQVKCWRCMYKYYPFRV